MSDAFHVIRVISRHHFPRARRCRVMRAVPTPARRTIPASRARVPASRRVPRSPIVRVRASTEDGDESTRDVVERARRATTRAPRRRAESTDAVATFMTRRFGLKGGLAWLGVLTFGVVSEQVKTRRRRETPS